MRQLAALILCGARLGDRGLVIDLRPDWYQMGLSNPIPLGLHAECKKVAKILSSFADPRQAFGPNAIIPPSILQNAKGLVVLSVLKAGFLFSGRVGSGLVVAKLSDGSWSAPSAIITAGMGFGGQIGGELTEFVMILNTHAAVESFAQMGSVTLGGNLSIAAGPVGRNAEAAGTASLKNVAAIFSYSKTKGLFAGVSLEGSVMIERRDANSKFYNQPVTAKQLLTGCIEPPPETDPLMRILDTRYFSGSLGAYGDDMYNRRPVYGGDDDDIIWNGKRSVGSAYGEDLPGNERYGYRNDYDDFDENRSGQNRLRSPFSDTARATTTSSADRSRLPKPDIGKKTTPTLSSNQVLAKYKFDGETPDDLSFKKGDIITVTKRTDSNNDWWTGTLDGRSGIFPANYVSQ